MKCPFCKSGKTERFARGTRGHCLDCGECWNWKDDNAQPEALFAGLCISLVVVFVVLAYVFR